MLLEIVDGDHASRLLDEERILVDSARARPLLVHLSHLQDVVEAVQRDLDDLVVHHCEQVAQRLDAAL